MCVEVWVRPDGPEIETQGQLAKFLRMPVELLHLKPHYPLEARTADACLCPIEVQRVLTEEGYAFEFDCGDTMSIVVTGKST